VDGGVESGDRRATSRADGRLCISRTCTDQVGRCRKVASQMIDKTTGNGRLISPGVALGRGKAETEVVSESSDC
jgi:hypothetical protein